MVEKQRSCACKELMVGMVFIERKEWNKLEYM